MDETIMAKTSKTQQGEQAAQKHYGASLLPITVFELPCMEGRGACMVEYVTRELVNTTTANITLGPLTI